jgi:DNA topoisomerase I
MMQIHARALMLRLRSAQATRFRSEQRFPSACAERSRSGKLPGLDPGGILRPVKKPLIIVESPTKARTIKKFLPARYAVKASVGHVRDLPKSTLGVDVEHDFAPRYLTIKGKGEIIKELRGAVKSATDVYLATDPDREGEAIAWHLAELLKLPDPKRIELHEITKEAALAALKHPHRIDINRVNAQQARRILDRLVGYKISPLLWAKVRGGLSAGRVQSVAVKLIVDREREIGAFIPREYWTVTALLAPEQAAVDVAFSAELVAHRGEKLELRTGVEADAVLQALEGAAYRVSSIKRREVRRNPPAPFTTSTLQQEASRKLKMRVRRAMQVAQSLYEGIDLGGSEGTVGLITYMRTDSTRISDQARDAAREFIVAEYGEEYHGGRRHRVREGAQDAHEAIRPTSILRTPAHLAHVLKRDDLRLYTMIWERFVASQMAAAVLDQTTVEALANAYTFRATGTVMRFSGFTRVYEESADEGAAKGRVRLPELRQDEALDCRKLESKQHFTEPPPRYSEAALVKALEDNGIGRPSTYSTIVETIQARGYVTQVERRFQPTEIGIAVNDLLVEHFPKILNLDFTARMEGDLDKVAEGHEDWIGLLRSFYGPFESELKEAEKKLPRLELRDEPTDEICPNCGRPMVIKTGRFGRFISCTGYPECKTAKPIVKQTGVDCPRCGGAIVERRSKRGRTFYGCATYPKCDFVSWDPVVAARCPVCNSHVVVKTRRGGAERLECAADRNHTVGLQAPDREPVEA